MGFEDLKQKGMIVWSEGMNRDEWRRRAVEEGFCIQHGDAFDMLLA